MRPTARAFDHEESHSTAKDGDLPRLSILDRITEKAPRANTRMTLKQLLTEGRNEIVATFLREVERKDLSPPGLTRSVLVDHLPQFLDEIGAELDRFTGARTSWDAEAVNASARQHGEQRWQVGYDLASVVREYGVLHHAILATARNAGLALSIDEVDLLVRYMNVGVTAATGEYVRAQEAQLRARQTDLEFLTEAGELLGSSLDYRSTLGHLTRLLVPRLADWCVIKLGVASDADHAVAHVNPELASLLGEALLSNPNSGEALATDEALLLEQVPADFLEKIAQSPEQLAALRRLGTCSWMVVPLGAKAGRLGTITLGQSDSGRHYDRSQLLLVKEVARRATAALDNARLFELSQEERARAEVATRAKDEFVATVSHELRTPLNVIIGWVRLLRGGGLPDKMREQALEVVERNANAQGQLVADLLDISRVITGKIRLEPAQVDLGSLVGLVLADARLALETKRLQVHASIPEDGTVIRGDAERLRQVVWNMLLNAIKFTPKGGDIWVALRRVDSELELSVRDSGVGIASQFLPHVFDIFRQSDSRTTRAHGGLGLGLSIVKHLVDLHGGSIEARSDGIGKGAEFVLRLPVSPLISATLGVTKVLAVAPARQALAPPTRLAGKHILIVDDEDDARDLLRFVLQSCDVSVHAAASAREALALVESEPIDAVVSDIGMPNEDGYFLIRNIRAMSGKNASIPALALTAFARNEDRDRALVEGFNAHMVKPVEPAELLVALADLMT